MIYILLSLIVLLLIFCYFIKRDIFHPICLICLSFAFSVFCAILNINNWGISLSLKTVKIIMFGIICFIIPGFFIHNKKIKNKKDIENFKIIRYSNVTMLILISIQFLFLLLYILWMKNYLGGFLNLFNSNLMTQFRFTMSFDQSIEYPIYISQGIKYSKALVYIFSFITIHNIIVNKKNNCKNKIDKMFYASILMFVFQTFISGGRSELILLILNIIVETFFIYNFYNNKLGTKIGKNFIKICVITLTVLYLFSLSRTIVGRTSNDGFIEYISRYFGGSIQLFDLYIKNPIQKSTIFGKEIFYGINKFLGQIGIVKESYTLHLEFRSSNGIELGNIYTAFRRMYQDFGMFGVVILNFIQGFIMSLYYKKIICMKRINFLGIKILFYFMIIHSIILMPFSDFFYSTILSINYVNIILYMLIIIFILKKINLKIKR